jgi:hypothetical protein
MANKYIALLILITICVVLSLIIIIKNKSNTSSSSSSTTTSEMTKPKLIKTPDPTADDFFPIISRSGTGVTNASTLNSDRQFYYNPTSNTLTVDNMRLSKVLDENGNFGSLYDVLTVNSNNTVGWQKLSTLNMLNPCDFSSFTLKISNSITIQNVGEYLLSLSENTSDTFQIPFLYNPSQLFSTGTLTRNTKHLFSMPFSSTVQQYTGYYNCYITTTTASTISNVIIKVYKVDYSSILIQNAVKLEQVLTTTLNSNGSNSYSGIINSYSQKEISKGDLIFITASPTLSSYTGTQFFMDLDLTILFM